MKTIKLAVGAVNAKLVDASDDDRRRAQHMLKFALDGVRTFGRDEWDGKGTFFEWATNVFPAGFAVKLFREFTKLGYRVEVIRAPFPAPLGPEFPVVDAFEEDPRYDYQRRVYELLLQHGKIIAKVATGGGKSRIAKLAWKRISRPTLFLTTRGILMHQMRDAFVADLKVPVGVYGDGKWHGPNPELMNVGMVQSFAAALALPDPTDPQDKQIAQNERRYEAMKVLEQFEFVILEEAHEASSASFYDVMSHCRKAFYRLALTATPFMKDSERDNMQLEAVSGPVAIQITERDLINRGILAKPYFKFIEFRDLNPEGVFVNKETKAEMKATLYRSTPYEKAYDIGIAGGIKRNAAVAAEVKELTSYGMSVMVLVQRKEHGKRLAELIDHIGVKCAFIRGEHSQTERKAAIEALKRGDIQCLIGSTILDVGVDVPAVGGVVIAGGGKAEVAGRQRIGRGLRAKRTGPNVCFIVDFSDDVNNHLRFHAQERKRIIETTPGFAEGIVHKFPFEELGFKKS